jgi:hypothetical protein
MFTSILKLSFHAWQHCFYIFNHKKSIQFQKNVPRDCKSTFYEHSQNTKLLYKKYYFGIEKHVSCLGFKKKTCSDCDTNQNDFKLTLSLLQILQEIIIST